MDKVPSTITDKQMAELRKRAEKVAPPLFSKQAVDQRKHHNKQKYKAEQS
jgi:hypothetical protein